MEQQPFLRPPTQEYIDKHCRSQPSATVSARERPAARLFEAMANEPEPTDLSKFFKEMPSAKELKEDLISSKRSRILLLLLSGVQALCGFAVTASLIQAQAETTRTAEDSMLLATLLLIGASGIIGLVGACRRVRAWSPARARVLSIPRPPLPMNLTPCHLHAVTFHGTPPDLTACVLTLRSLMVQMVGGGAAAVLHHADMVALDALQPISQTPAGAKWPCVVACA